MDVFRIMLEMDRLAHKIDYPTNVKNGTKEINNLIDAMCCTKTGASKTDRVNSRLALVGDSILDLVLEDYCIEELDLPTPKIDDMRQEYLSDESEYRAFIREGLCDFAYNDYGFFYEKTICEQVSMNADDFPYLEAIVGAAYYDAGFDATYTFVKDKILPLLGVKTQDKNN